MKKLFTVALLLLCGMTIYAQSISDAKYVSNFKMNYDGNFSTQDCKDYDVAVIEGKDATELFDLVRKHVSLAFRSPKDIESNINDKIISIYGYAPKCTFFTAPGFKFYLSFHFSLKFQFKDGKIRIEAPILSEMEGSAWPTLQKTFKAKGIFSKEGVLSDNPKKRQTVTMLENYFNNLINRIINGDSKANEDW